MLDGASGVGKTTLAHGVAGSGLAKLVQRYTTRAPRHSDEPEYKFVGDDEFRTMAERGAFLEYRHYEFGMSYGLPWKETFETLLSRRHAVAITNLNRARVVKSNWPHTVTILIDVPMEELERRLRARGSNTEEQIQERLANARTVDRDSSDYDLVVQNTADPEIALKEILRVIEDLG